MSFLSQDTLTDDAGQALKQGLTTSQGRQSVKRTGSDVSEYDDHGNKINGPKSSNLQASFTLFKAFIGAGILTLSSSYNKVGFIPGCISIMISGYLTYHCMMLLIAVLDDIPKSDRLNVQQLADKVLGKKGKISVEVAIIIIQLGIATAILIFSTSTIDHIICNSAKSSLCHSKLFQSIFAAIVVIPLSLITNMHYFYYPSLMATFFVFVNVIVQISWNVHTFAQDPEGPSHVLHNLTQFNLYALPNFFGVACYAFEGVGVVFSIRSSMQNPQNFSKILRRQMLIVCLLYIIFPGSGALVFGDKIPEIILYTLPAGHAFFILTQVMYVISTLLGYPVQIFPAFHIFENYETTKKYVLNKKGSLRDLLIRYLMRSLIIVGMILIAINVKSFNLFLNFLGSGVFTYLGFLLPIIVYQTHFGKKVSTKLMVFNYTAFIFNTILGGLGVYTSLKALITGESSGH